MTTLALNPFSASAADASTATTTTLKAPASVVTGHALTITAIVSPSKTGGHPVVRATGSVTFTIVGSHASVVNCTNTPVVTAKGRALCKVAAGSLQAAASPYSVTAVYSGDDNFIGSTGTLSQTVTAAPTRLKLMFESKPTSGSASTFIATVTATRGLLPDGSVQFSVSSSPAPTNTALLKCAHGNNQVLSANDATPPVQTATCALSAKWFKVPAPTTTDPKPVASWTVTATYASANGNFRASNATKSGATK